ncbi:hypothetical protein [Hymenobacter lapidarius]|uniref:hypothetical protein n=1 Tax=Hymenobacter lapidarius TaxID=1908237 RepID=UPI0013016A55|nr:hypothetical protein [Hymenobacter lapidarius]
MWPGAQPPPGPNVLAQPTAKDAYSNVLPGVLRRYNLPDLQRALGEKMVLG